MTSLMELYPGRFANLEELKSAISIADYKKMVSSNFVGTDFVAMANVTRHCDYATIIAEVRAGFRCWKIYNKNLRK